MRPPEEDADGHMEKQLPTAKGGPEPGAGLNGADTFGTGGYQTRTPENRRAHAAYS